VGCDSVWDVHRDTVSVRDVSVFARDVYRDIETSFCVECVLRVGRVSRHSFCVGCISVWDVYRDTERSFCVKCAVRGMYRDTVCGWDMQMCTVSICECVLFRYKGICECVLSSVCIVECVYSLDTQGYASAYCRVCVLPSVCIVEIHMPHTDIVSVHITCTIAVSSHFTHFAKTALL